MVSYLVKLKTLIRVFSGLALFFAQPGSLNEQVDSDYENKSRDKNGIKNLIFWERYVVAKCSSPFLVLDQLHSTDYYNFEPIHAMVYQSAGSMSVQVSILSLSFALEQIKRI